MSFAIKQSAVKIVRNTLSYVNSLSKVGFQNIENMFLLTNDFVYKKSYGM